MPPWSDIDTAMFDMDGTLLDLHFDNYFWQEFLPQVMAQSQGISERAAKAILEQKSAAVSGTLDWYCLDYWNEQLQLDIHQLKHQIKHHIAIRPNVEELLRQLQSQPMQLLLVSNAHPLTLALKLAHTGIDQYFQHCISSHSFNLAKENQGFWQLLSQKHPYDPRRTILFDDSLAVLKQAKREGIRHLYGISRPDSHKQAMYYKDFPMVDDFKDINPAQSPHSPV
ncbi:MAG: haloacid dehalogenase [SAR86 cluster bacterium]|uniref:Haloacid dehalogenase n=1 Tax=SAR86 cluster bacterium TaxID=2030880 RepID=A0A2A4MTH1_9GAMM|nr:MAG: haloacid dehalogenase [SAR86 cluster bacterium]